MQALELIADTEKVLTSLFGKRVTISISFSDEDLTYKFELPERRTLTEILIDLCEKEFRIESIMRKTNKHFYISARFCFYYLSYKYLGLTYSSIGQILGKDHSTVVSGISKCNDLIDSDDGFKNRILNIEKRFQTYL